MKESDIKKFWNKHPCGDHQVENLRNRQENYDEFFSDYDKFRYQKEAHILACLNQIDFKGKKTLEIGLGQGADSEQIIRRGAIWSGLDITPESVTRVQARLSIRGLSYEDIKEGSALQIPYKKNSFDIVFSHGVLHHVPDVKTAQTEIHRVLKPNGELIIMLYSRWSLNYLLSISFLRRLGLLGIYYFKLDLGEQLNQHLENARLMGLIPYLRMSNFIHKNTDGPLNPYSKVYDLKTVKKDFPDFRIHRTYKRFMHAPPLPVGRLPLEQLLGWHLWVHLKPITEIKE